MNIGIITFYYNSVNYGGLLQAYALVQYLRKNGANAEQICYKQTKDIPLHSRVKSFIKHHIHRNEFRNRNKNIKLFRDGIPHSEELYDFKTIECCKGRYEILVAGGDQIWNPDWIEPAYLLGFEQKSAIKVSYSVSIGKQELTPIASEMMKKYVPGFHAISLREPNSNELLQSFISKKICNCVDPVFLLDKKDWEELTDDKNPLGQKYLYCHLIGDGQEERVFVKKYAQRHRLKIVNIPHPSRHNKNDVHFGDIQFMDADPITFIRLIKNAEIIFTDSFHCAAFSIIFNKNFFVFHRKGARSMGGRVITLLQYFDATRHFIEDERIHQKILDDTIPPIDYCNHARLFKQKIDESKQYVKENILNITK